ncbi:MAG: sulfurtransferase complex subunit TusC [Cycloclasticus sp.]
MKSIFFIIDKPLHGNIQTQEFIDIALMAAAFDQRVVMLFEGDGVYALLQQQAPEAIGLKNSSSLLKALSLYDINDVFVEAESMRERGLSSEQFVIKVNVCPRAELKQQQETADQLFSF